jgi:hypothetical protein
VIIFLTFLQLQAMAPEKLPPGVIGAESSRMTGASRNAPLSNAQQQRRHQLVHCDTAIVATENMTQDAHLKKVHTTGSSKNMKQHLIGCESIHIGVNDGQQRIECTAVVRSGLRHEFVICCNGKSPWSTKACVRAVRDIEYHDVASSGIVADKFHDKCPREWTKPVHKTLEEATGVVYG